VQKLDPTGSTLIFSTYFGAGAFAMPGGSTGIGVDDSGSAYVVGYGISVPLKNALEQGVGGAFLAKFTPDGTDLVYSTDLGGSGAFEGGADTAVAVAVDASGNAYVTGNAVSPDFPITMNAFKASCSESASEACRYSQTYVLKVDPIGASLLYSTLIGAGMAASIAVDSSGNAWVTGATFSNYFPVLQAVESSLPQNALISSQLDSFLTRLDPSGMPTFSTYLGGSYAAAVGVAADNSGSAYVSDGI
jgi:hypothetical protein